MTDWPAVRESFPAAATCCYLILHDRARCRLDCVPAWELAHLHTT